MTGLGYKIDQKLVDVLKQEKFTLSAEVIPPRNGIEQAKVFEQIGRLVKSGARFLSVTKGAGGSLRGGSLPIAQAVKEHFQVPSIAHFTCRDLTPGEVENQLMDHHYFGIRNILALRGDPPTGQKDWQPKAGSHTYAYQLIEQIRGLNTGEYLERADEKFDVGKVPPEKTDFCIGCAVYPEHPDLAEQLRFYRMKIDAGAEYSITQMIFDVDAYSRFRDEAQAKGLALPILPGTRILKSKKQARAMAARFEVSVADSLLRKLPEEYTPEAQDDAVSAAMDLIREFENAGAPGVHLFVLSDTELSSTVLGKLRN